MMKQNCPHLILALLLLTPATNIIFAKEINNTQERLVTIQNYQVNPTPYNEKAKIINCAQFIDQIYETTMTNGAFNLEGQFALRHPRFYSVTESHGLKSVHWVGTWVYYKPDGKEYQSKIFGAQVSNNQKTTLGVFKNKYCFGAYSIIPQEKTSTPFLNAESL